MYNNKYNKYEKEMERLYQIPTISWIFKNEMLKLNFKTRTVAQLHLLVCTFDLSNKPLIKLKLKIKRAYIW